MDLEGEGEGPALNPDHLFVEALITRPDGEGFSPAKRVEENLAAIRTLKAIEDAHEPPTLEQRETLARYNGFGGLAPVMSQTLPWNAPEWQRNARNQLIVGASALLSPDERELAAASVLNAHFTPPQTIKAIYAALERAGFRGGDVLDPAMGVGNFFGLMPEAMVRRSRLEGVELDSLSARMASHIYPDAQVHACGFEQAPLADGVFDLAVGNVPFGNYTVADHRYNRYSLSIHNYFLVKTLDKLRPGGLCALITSAYTLDAKNTTARELMAERADLVGAVRLPDTAQQAQAGVKVTTDILFFRKKDGQKVSGAIDPEQWIRSEPHPEHPEFHINRLMIDQPERILGTLQEDSAQGGRRILSVKASDARWAEQIPALVADVKALVPQAPLERVSGNAAPNLVLDEDEFSAEGEPGERLAESDFGRHYPGTLMQGETGDILEVYRDALGKLRTRAYTPKGKALQGKALARLQGMIAVRDAMDALVNLQISEASAAEVDQAMASLNATYDAFTRRHGWLNDPVNARLFQSDPESGRLMALEHYDDEKKTASKADIFTQRVINNQELPVTAETPLDALHLCLIQHGEILPERIAELCGQEAADCMSELVESAALFINPVTGKPELAATYLSGNVREKLVQAERALARGQTQYQINAEALKRALPKDLGPGDIRAELGASWLTPEDMKEFLAENDLRGTIRRREHDGRWIVEGLYGADIAQYRGARRTPEDILQRLCNNEDLSVYTKKTVPGPDGTLTEKSVLDEQASFVVEAKAEQFKQAFQAWIWKSPERTERLVRRYNERFNAHVEPHYDGSFLRFPGMSLAVELRAAQKNAVLRGLIEGNLLLAHEVGVGKTYSMIALAKESRRLGRCTKPVIVVPNHMLGQIHREGLQLYPNAKILAVSKDDLSKSNRRKTLGLIANNNWDLVVITHSMFNLLGDDPVFLKEFYRKERERLIQALKTEEQSGHYTGKKKSLKEMQTKIARINAKLHIAEQEAQEANDAGDTITLEQMGVDMLLVDEAHNYKNLAAETGRASHVAQAISGSQRAEKLHIKLSSLYDRLRADRNVVFASGTPITNNLLEIYNLMRYLQPTLLERLGIESVNQWASVFLKPITRWEPAPSGHGFVQRVRFALTNVDEVLTLLRQVMDVVTADEAGVVRPDMETVNVVCEMNEDQRIYKHYLGRRATKLSKGNVDPKEDNILKIITEGRQMAIDVNLLDPMHQAEIETSLEELARSAPEVPPDDEGLFDDPEARAQRESEQREQTQRVNNKIKWEALCDNVYRIWQESAKDKGAQLVFCDMGTPSASRRGRFDVYNAIKNRLIEMGIPEEEVAFMSDAKGNDKKKAAIQERVRNGSIRIIIGSTQLMGEGTNMQTRAVAVHHLDCPWRCSDVEQRDGRIRRFGNLFKNVRRFIYTTRNAGFDEFIWNTVKSKAESLKQAMLKPSGMRELDMEVDPSLAQTVALTTGNPLLLRKMELDQEVSKLTALSNHWENERYNLRSSLGFLKDNQEDYLRRQARLEQYPTPTPEPKDQAEAHYQARIEKLERELQRKRAEQEPGEKGSGGFFTEREIEGLRQHIKDEKPLYLWRFDLRPYGFDSEYCGNREGMLRMVNKVLAAAKPERVDTISFGGVPVQVICKLDSKGKPYATWSFDRLDGKAREAQRSVSLEEDLLERDGELERVARHLEDSQARIERLERELAEEKINPHRPSLEALRKELGEVDRQIQLSLEESNASVADPAPRCA